MLTCASAVPASSDESAKENFLSSFAMVRRRGTVSEIFGARVSAAAAGGPGLAGGAAVTGGGVVVTGGTMATEHEPGAPRFAIEAFLYAWYAGFGARAVSSRPNVSPLGASWSVRLNQPRPETPGTAPAIRKARASQSAWTSRVTNQSKAQFVRSDGTANSDSQSGL